MKKVSKILLLFVLTITLGTTLSVKAVTSKTVNSEVELKEALNNSNVSTIILGSNIETTEKIKDKIIKETIIRLKLNHEEKMQKITEFY